MIDPDKQKEEKKKRRQKKWLRELTANYEKLFFFGDQDEGPDEREKERT
jgi:hypothetical protein